MSKPLGWGQGFQEKFLGCPPILGFIAFLLTSLSKICLGWWCCFIPTHPHMCIYDHSCNNLVDVVRYVTLLTSWLVTYSQRLVWVSSFCDETDSINRKSSCLCVLWQLNDQIYRSFEGGLGTSYPRRPCVHAVTTSRSRFSS